MRVVKSVFNILFFGLLALPSIAQEVDTVDVLRTDARVAFDYADYHRAIELYDAIHEFSPRDPQSYFMEGVCLFSLGKIDSSLVLYDKAKSVGYKAEEYIIGIDRFRGEVFSPILAFNIGLSYYFKGDFGTALKHFESVLQLVPVEDEITLNNLNQFIQWTTNGLELTDLSKTHITLENLGPRINTEFDETAPLITANEKTLVFTSTRPSGRKGTQDKFGTHKEDIYISHVMSTGKWFPGFLISQNINKKEHDACIGLSGDGHHLLLSISKNHKKSDIYESHKDGNHWSKPKKLKGDINSNASEASGSLSSDGTMIVFSSDRPGGKGGKDIYSSKLLPTGEWSEARNLNINTAEDEFSPFLHADGETMYFSSKGHKTIGGYDLYKSIHDPETDTWSEPVNLGYPINTARDEIFFTWSPDGRRAYFSSNREGSFGGSDIYKMVYEEGESSTILLLGKITDGETEEPLKATIKVTDNDADAVVAIFESDEQSGEYTVSLHPGKNYGLFIESPNYLPESKNLHIAEKFMYYEKKEHIELQRLKEGSITVLNNVFFDQNSSELNEESHIELDKFARIIRMSKNIDIEVAGHTEVGGLTDYNDQLSQERAQSVVNYLIKKGVPKERLYPIGYGGRHPVSKKRSEAEKAKNRRTELIVHRSKTDDYEWKPYYERDKEQETSIKVTE